MSPEPVEACGWSRDRIQSCAEKAAKSLGYKPGDDLERIVESLGGRVEVGDLGSASHTGSMTVEQSGNFVISLSPFSGARRDRFTIAHELGHYILHSKMGEKAI